MRVHRGNDGWCLVTGETGLPGSLYVRLTADDDGQERISEIYVDGQGKPVTTSGLRNFPLRPIEEAARNLKQLRGSPGPDLSRLATYFSTTFSVREDLSLNRSHWAADSMHAQTNWRREKVPQAPRMPAPSSAESREEDLPPLQLPEGRALTDVFLSDVADRYQEAVSRRRPPAVAIADAVDVNKRTVEGWIAKARKRGFLAPATGRGRVV